MNRVSLLFFTLYVLACVSALAQEPGAAGNHASGTLHFEDGSLANGIYSNECFGFSFPIPQGWEVNTHFGTSGKARHMPHGEIALLLVEQKTQSATANKIALTAIEAAPGARAPDVVKSSVETQIKIDPQNRQVLREVFAVTYGGKEFSREDYKQSLGRNSSLYLSFVLTNFRGYFIGGTLVAASLEELDTAANSLGGIFFQEDHPNPMCVMAGDSQMPGGVISGIISSKPRTPKPGDPPLTVRVSSEVSSALLIKKVQPAYPDEARRQHVEGRVALQALIDTNGDVQELTLLSGDPLLVSAARDAVKQWKYKPYLLNGQPLNVDTVVIVEFELMPK